MKKSFYLILGIFMLSILQSCEKSENPVLLPDGLQGSWSNRVIEDSFIKFDRMATLPDNDYGISFEEQQLFIERKNVGFCGTPPITYGNFQGTWSVNDSIIQVTVEGWNGFVDYQWKIVTVTDDHLYVVVLSENYHN